MKKILIAVFFPFVLITAMSCGRFSNPATDAGGERYVVISPIYNEIIWALGAQDKVVGIDLSSTYPAEVKMNDGKLVANATASEILTTERIREVFEVKARFVPVEGSGLHLVFD